MGGHLFLDLLEASFNSCLYGTPHSIWLRVKVVWMARPARCMVGLQPGSHVTPSMCQARKSHASSPYQLVESRLLLYMVPTSCLAVVSPILSSPLPATPERVAQQAQCITRCPTSMRRCQRQMQHLGDILLEPSLLMEGKVMVFAPAPVDYQFLSQPYLLSLVLFYLFLTKLADF